MKIYRNTFVKRNWYLYVPFVFFLLVIIFKYQGPIDILVGAWIVFFFGGIAINNYLSTLTISGESIILKSLLINKKIKLSEATKIDINPAWLLPQVCINGKKKEIIYGLNNYVNNVSELKELIAEITKHNPGVKVDFDWNSLVARRGLF